MIVDLKNINLKKLKSLMDYPFNSFINKSKKLISLNNLFLIIILINLINQSNCTINKENATLIKEFNLAFNNFLNDWKSKNPNFNLSTIKYSNELFNQSDFRLKRELNLEDELEYVLKTKVKKNNDFNFERKQKSDSDELNSLEDKSLDQPIEQPTCITCKPHESLRKLRLEQIKREILRKLNLERPPNVNLSSIPKQLILDNFQKNDPNYQDDQNLDDYVDDDEEMRVNQIYTFSEKAPDYLKLDDNIQYFNLSYHLNNTRVIDSELNFKIKTTPEFDSLNNTAYIKVYRIERTLKGNDQPFLVLKKKINVFGESNWIKVNVNDLINLWTKHPNKNLGLFIHCYDEFGRNFDQPYSRELESSTFIKTIHRPLKRTRSKRSKKFGNDCNKDLKTPLCCRWPLKVSFAEIDLDFIIAPEYYEAYYCAGQCNFGNSKEVNHSYIMHYAKKGSAICCTGQKHSGISIVFIDKNKNLVYGQLTDMVVERCGCSS